MAGRKGQTKKAKAANNVETGECSQSQSLISGKVVTAGTSGTPKGKSSGAASKKRCREDSPEPAETPTEVVSVTDDEQAGTRGRGGRRLGVIAGSRKGTKSRPAADDVELQHPRTGTQVIREITDILLKSKEAEKALMDVDEICDSGDEASVNNLDNSQETMGGEKSYTETAYKDEGDDADEDGEEEGELDLTRLRLIDQNVSIYDDPTKSHDDWWSEDKTREPTLCELWQESDWLYDFRSKKHVAEDKNTTLRRFSTVLQVPPGVIETRMSSLRSQFQKMFRSAKSGSEPEGETLRQKEILRLCYFLRGHIKTSPSLTNYTSTAKPAITAKSTPAKKGKGGRAAKEPELDLSAIIQDSPKPMSHAQLTASEAGSEGSDADGPILENTKHFSRNGRLQSARGVAAVTRRSLELQEKDEPEEEIVTKKAPAPKKGQVQAKKAANTKEKISTEKDGGKVEKKPVQSAASRKALMEQGKLAVDPAPPVKKTTAADRKEAMASCSKDTTYDVSVDSSTKWYDEQGAGYRKALEGSKKKKLDPFLAIMEEKGKNMRELITGVQKLTERPPTPSKVTSSADGDSPEQLWANSLVPQLLRMSEDTRDEFMPHVTALAFKAIRGRWQPTD